MSKTYVMGRPEILLPASTESLLSLSILISRAELLYCAIIRASQGSALSMY